MSVSGSQSGGAELSAEDFEAIEAAVLETRKGRWFLGEFAKRHRTADTLMLIETMQKFEAAIGRQAAAGAAQELAALAATISATRADIAAVRNDMISGGGVLENTPVLYCEISRAAASAAEELMTRSQSLSAVAQSLKAKDADESPAVETDALSLQTLAWQQDILSQRLAKAMGLLAHLDERIAAIAQPAAPPAARLAERLTPENLEFFKRDEDVFAPEPSPPAPKLFEVKNDAPTAPPATRAEAADAEPRRRVVIIRRPPREQIAIPLAGEQQAPLAG